MTVTAKEYYKDLKEFCKINSKYECKIYTSPMINNCYRKTYCFENGATFYEVNDIVHEAVEVEIHGIKASIEVKLARTEYWSTFDSQSKFIYTIV